MIKNKRVRITRTLDEKNYEKLREASFKLRKSESSILDDLLSGFKYGQYYL